MQIGVLMLMMKASHVWFESEPPMILVVHIALEHQTHVTNAAR